MTAEEFRQAALALPGAAEGEHMRHPDYRANGRVFATLGYPNEEWRMVKVTPEDQQRLVWEHAPIFVPVKGAWGLQGCTNVKLAAGQRDVVALALDLAWQRSAAEGALKAKKGVRRAAAKGNAKNAM